MLYNYSTYNIIPSLSLSLAVPLSVCTETVTFLLTRSGEVRLTVSWRVPSVSVTVYLSALNPTTTGTARRGGGGGGGGREIGVKF